PAWFAGPVRGERAGPAGPGQPAGYGGSSVVAPLTAHAAAREREHAVVGIGRRIVAPVEVAYSQRRGHHVGGHRRGQVEHVAVRAEAELVGDAQATGQLHGEDQPLTAPATGIR